MRYLIALAGACGLLASLALAQSQSRRPCEAACQNWYAGGASLCGSNPFCQVSRRK